LGVKQGEPSVRLFAVWTREKGMQPKEMKLFDGWIQEASMASTTKKASVSER
jgi:hypothetical protein